MKTLLRRGDPFIWLTGSALAICLLMIGGLVVIIYNDMGVFWPRDLVEFELVDGSRVMGRQVGRQEIFSPSGGTGDEYRVQLKTGNRDVYGLDFRWIDEAEIRSREYPYGAVVFERLEWGDFYGFVTGDLR